MYEQGCGFTTHGASSEWQQTYDNQCCKSKVEVEPPIKVDGTETR
jgi:hypothetical protein